MTFYTSIFGAQSAKKWQKSVSTVELHNFDGLVNIKNRWYEIDYCYNFYGSMVGLKEEKIFVYRQYLAWEGHIYIFHWNSDSYIAFLFQSLKNISIYDRVIILRLLYVHT